jgi:hypothetical protein
MQELTALKQQWLAEGKAILRGDEWEGYLNKKE